MKLGEAKAQVEREHPELTGRAKIEAIKALRDQAAANQPAEVKDDSAGFGDRRCDNCQQQVRPDFDTGLVFFLRLVTLFQAAAVLASLAAVLHRSVKAGPLGQFATWPALIHPSGLGVLAAVAAFILAATLAVKATEHAKLTATCPICKTALLPADVNRDPQRLE